MWSGVTPNEIFRTTFKC
uniref:Uncharacterized protein n=1 Tax=Rhizophora mucronata TaxID=61149 RepID=A0A2P2J0F6_RHIMU